MTTGMNLCDMDVWSFVLTLSYLFIAMILANVLRNVCRFIRRLMIPSSVLGGFLLLLANWLFKVLTGAPLYPTSSLEILTYHGLGLGFAALSLRATEKKAGRSSSAGFDTGVTVVNGYLLQAIMGLVVTIGLYYLIDSFFASGILLPMGYGRGPGRRITGGHTYEVSYGFTNGTSFGLAVAAMGFGLRQCGGRDLPQLAPAQGHLPGEMGSDVQEEISLSTFAGENEVPLTESMDKFTIQLALVFIAYALAFLCMRLFNLLLDPTGQGPPGIAGTIQSTIWGFQFLFSSVFALLIRAAMKSLRRKGVIRREYTNTFMQNRIAGFMFDLMVVASIAAIDLSAFRQVNFILPLGIISVVGAVGTYYYLRFVCHRIYPWYEHEAFLSLYGMQTGTASTGTILLRELDPKFQTQAADNLVYHMPWAILFGAPMFLLMGVAPQGVTQSLITLIACVALFAVFNVILFRRSIFKKAAVKK